MMVEAAPSASFIVPKPDLLLEFLIVAFDPPAQFGDVDQIAERDAFWQRREPVFGWLVFSLRPLNQQPLFAGLFAGLVTMSDLNAKAREPGGQPVVCAFSPLDRLPSFPGQPECDVLNRDQARIAVASPPGPFERRLRLAARRPHQDV